MKIKTLKLISNAISAPVVALIVPLVFAYPSFLDIITGLLFIGIFPIVLWFYYYRRGWIDFDVSNREERTKFFMVGILSYFIAMILFLNKPMMFALSCVYFFSTISIMIINLKWKISVHCSGLAGPVTAVFYVFGGWTILLYLLVLFVMWLRIKLEAHTFWQVVGGSVEGILITFFIYFIIFS